MVFFRMVLNNKHFRGSNVKQSVSPVKLEKMKNRCTLSKNCSIHGKNHEIFCLYNSWTHVKKMFLIFEVGTVGPCLVVGPCLGGKKRGGGGSWPPWPPCSYAPDLYGKFICADKNIDKNKKNLSPISTPVTVFLIATKLLNLYKFETVRFSVCLHNLFCENLTAIACMIILLL